MARLEESLRLAHGGLEVQRLDVLPLLLAVVRNEIQSEAVLDSGGKKLTAKRPRS